VAVLGLVWLNWVAAAVMDVGGSCGSGGPYEIARPCPTGAWMAPVGIFVGLAGLAAYAFLRPSGSPNLLTLTWPALFGSLGVQFLRAASGESNAYGWLFCGLLFLAMAAAPLALIIGSDRRALVRMLLGDGLAEVDPADRPRTFAPTPAPGVNVAFVTPSTDDPHDADLAERLDRLSRLHRCGDLSDAEFAEAKQQVLDGA
jgi:hypothetical protein